MCGIHCFVLTSQSELLVLSPEHSSVGRATEEVRLLLALCRSCSTWEASQSFLWYSECALKANSSAVGSGSLLCASTAGTDSTRRYTSIASSLASLSHVLAMVPTAAHQVMSSNPLSLDSPSPLTNTDLLSSRMDLDGISNNIHSHEYNYMIATLPTRRKVPSELLHHTPHMHTNYTTILKKARQAMPDNVAT